MHLPDRNSFVLHMIHKDLNIPDEHLKIIEEFSKQADPYYDQRRQFDLFMRNKVLCSFYKFLFSYNILKNVLKKNGQAINIPLLSICQDALRQNISDLSELIKEFCSIRLNEISAKYSNLFKKKSQNKLFNFGGDNQELINFSLEIDKKRSDLFRHFNEQGNVSDINWYFIRKHLDALIMNLKEYRDKIGSHDEKSSSEIKLTFEEIDLIISEFEQIILDLYTIGTFQKKPAPLEMEHDPKATEILLINEIWGDYK